VWQDYDGDGVTDAGELKTLDQLGIAEFDLNSTAFDAVTGNAIEWVSEEGISWVGVNDNDRSASDAQGVA
jgi:hypothetical protein